MAEPRRTRRGGHCPVRSCTSALKPSPACSSRLETSQRPSSAPAASTRARDAGCKDCRANAAANDKALARSRSPPASRTVCNAIASRVSVPVLSNTTVSICARASSPCRLRTSTPCRASVPAAVNIATGVANDNAQGQVTMSTATATISACPGSLGHHQAAAAKAASNTATKNGLAMRSASWARRGFCRPALSIKATICAKRVWAPTHSTRTSTDDCRL